MRITSALALLTLLIVPSVAHSQGDIGTTLVELDERVASSLAREFRSPNEKLWCVDTWTSSVTTDYTLLHVSQVHEAEVAATNGAVRRATDACRNADGSAQPTIHSHPGGSCQASGSDRMLYISRRGAFDGILCGTRYTAWYFSSELITVATSLGAR
jgi:proteasome lid subunit RPN8/RPN11